MSKETTAVYVYNGAEETLLSAIHRAIDTMNLNIKREYAQTESISFEVSEKMKWLTTNWPVSFEIKASLENRQWTLVVRGSSTLTSYTQEFSNQAKVNEFLELVKSFAPNNKADSSVADLEKLAELRDKGIITEEEFNQKKKQILSL
jgi:hypothetical protein